MKKISLTRGLFALVDDDDFEHLSKHKWHAAKNGSGKFYAARTSKKIKMHRVIMNAGYKTLIDHVNGDSLDNRKVNLRCATSSQNSMNTKPRKGTSMYKGVSWNERTSKYVAQITAYGKKLFIGRFVSEKEAAKAYNAAAIKLHGEYACLNAVN